MSAYVVDREHIDALVCLAVRGPGGRPINPCRAWHGVRWLPDSDSDWRDALHAEHGNADMIGRMLWAENVRSIHYRYPDTVDRGNLPGPSDFTEAEVFTYVWPFSAPRLTAVQGLGAIDCYEYQSCEHPGWASSEAGRFCDALRRKLIGALPGYGWDLSAVRS
jgi:hypothetical protein